jgi:3-oxoacyl-[acyl-carrier protein] reductase
MDMGLKGRAALVSGASRGLGLAIARGLAAEGCNVSICARGQEVLDAAAQGIKDEFKVDVLAQAVDVSQPGAAEGMVKAAIEHYGRLDVLVTNAGGPPPGFFDDFSQEDWQKAVELTLFSALGMARAALPTMRQAGWGRIINMTSISVKQPISNLLLSNSIRAAVTGWAKSLADEEGKNGITVNNICTGLFRTERMEKLAQARAQTQGVTPEEVITGMAAEVPLGRLGNPEEYGDLAVFLASERASYINGVSYLIDGGLYRGLM